MRWIVVCAVGSWMATWCAAHDFVVHTELISNTSPPQQENITTIFCGQQVFDSNKGDADSVTVFDLQQETIWRLDARSHTREQLHFEMLLRLVDEASLRAVRVAPLIRFAANPQFTNVAWRPTENRLTLQHDLMSYQVDVDSSCDATTSAKYRAFADWSARLNTLRPGLPPGARLELNRQIAVREALPVVVRCQRRTTTAVEELVARHDFQNELSTADVEKVARYRKWLTDFEEQPWQR